MKDLIKKLEEQKGDLVRQIAEITNEYSGRPLTPEELELYHLKRSILDEYLRQLGNYGKKKE
jgi:hypothetical protein